MNGEFERRIGKAKAGVFDLGYFKCNSKIGVML